MMIYNKKVANMTVKATCAMPFIFAFIVAFFFVFFFALMLIDRRKRTNYWWR